MANPRQNRAQRGSAAGQSNSYGDYIQAMNYYINMAFGKEPTPRQREAVDRLNSSDLKRAESDAGEQVRVLESKSSSSSTVPVPEPRPERAPKPTDSGRGNPPPRRRSAMDVQRDSKELAARAAERQYGSGPDAKRPSPVDTKSKKSIIERLMMELRGEIGRPELTRKRMEENREDAMETMGRKKGGMAKKKKAPVKKAYGGMVKKKQGGSARKVNMKAGFTRRGCSKG